MAKRANRKTNPLGLPAYNLPNGTIYRPTAAAGSQGSYGATLPVNFGNAIGVGVNLAQQEQQRVQQLQIQRSGFQTPTSTTAFKPQPAYTGTAGYSGQFGQYQGFQTPTSTTAFRPPSQANFQTPTSTTAFQNPATTYSANYMNPAYAPYAQPSQPAVVARPAGTYTGDPNDPNTAAWKNYWNTAVASPSAVEQPQGGGGAPKVMTRGEIWEMKARSRRKRMAQEEGDGGGWKPVSPKTQEKAQLANSYYSTMINTGGG